MNSILASGLITFLILISGPAYSDDLPLEFPQPETGQRYNHLVENLRCLVCQNQSLADSNADLARDLKLEVYKMMINGKSDREIIDYLVARYGDFVLYRPPFKSTTVLLWLGPGIFLLTGIWLAVTYMRRQKTRTLDAKEQHYADILLGVERQEDVK